MYSWLTATLFNRIILIVYSVNHAGSLGYFQYLSRNGMTFIGHIAIFAQNITLMVGSMENRNLLFIVAGIWE